MGYRSDVVVLMYGEGAPEDNAMVKEFVRIRLDSYSGGAPSFVREAFDFDGWGVKFQCEQWKWHDTYPEVKFIQELCKEFEEAFIADSKSAYALEFYRIGEEEDDIQYRHKGFMEGRMYLNRNIVLDGKVI